MASAEEMLDDMYSRLYTAADNSISKFKPKKYYSKPWWNAECKRVWKERKIGYRKYKTSGR